jgi:signal transduction histidine kinase
MTTNPKSEPSKGQAPAPPAIRFASLILVCLTIIALGAAACFTERGIVVRRDWVIHSYQVRSHLNDLQLEGVRAQANETNFLRLAGTQSLPPSAEQADLARQTVRQPPQQRLTQLGQIVKDDRDLLDGQRNPEGTRVQLSPSERKRREEIGAGEKQIAAIVSDMQEEQAALLEQRLKAWDYLFKRNVMMLGLAFAVVTLMLAYHFRLLVLEVAHTKDTEKRSRTNAESYRLMSARILELQDSERRPIARELHDSVGQYLAGLKINLNQLQTGVRIDVPSLLFARMWGSPTAPSRRFAQSPISYILPCWKISDSCRLPAGTWMSMANAARSRYR